MPLQQRQISLTPLMNLGQILAFLWMSDTVDGQSLVLSIYEHVLEFFPNEPSFYELDNDGNPSYTQQNVYIVLISMQRSAHYTEVNAHPQIWDVLELIFALVHLKPLLNTS